MTDSTEYKAQLSPYLTALLDGDIGDEESRQLERILTADAGARRHYCRYLELHVMLQFEQQVPRSPAQPSESAEAVLEYIRSASAELFRQGVSPTDLPIAAPPVAAPLGDVPLGPIADEASFGPPPIENAWRSTVWATWLPLTGVVWLLMAAMIGGMVTWLLVPRARTKQTIAGGEAGAAVAGTARRNPQFVATLANVTSCQWDKAINLSDAPPGSLQPGQSLHLLEGVAAINSKFPDGGVCRFQLEGPLGMILTSEGMPSLQFGKLTAQIPLNLEHFIIDTPLGRVAVERESSIGIIASASDVELHVFTGSASFEPWSTGFEASAPVNVASRDSLRIRVAADETVSLVRGNAHEDWFVATASMAASRLLIDDRYVQAIRRDRPVAYWRFEEIDSPLVRNEMSDRFHCRAVGDPIRWHQYRGNHYADFGSTTEGGCLMSDDTFDDVLDKTYSVEAWVKPSHFHHGTILSLMQYSPNEPTIDFNHSMVVEMIGAIAAQNSIPRGQPGVISTWLRYPGRIRFVHRNPPGPAGHFGCFSDFAYALRKWQHVVCVKDESSMRLYIDGKMAAQESDASGLAPGVRVLIGQLRPQAPNRPVAERQFIGELDEIAVYDRALSEQEIRKHFELVQTPTDESPRPAARDL
jgi:hypothetical protein